MASPLYVKWPNAAEVANNWGDKLNPALCVLLSGREVVNAWSNRPKHEPVYLVIGSSLRTASDTITVWGTGFIAEDNVLSGRPSIRAVRGPLSRRKVLSQGVDCPDVVGDAAVLFPLFYRPVIEPTYDIGVIRHCRELDLPGPVLPPHLSVRYIDINGSLSGVVDDILSCRAILSSSLHGIIAAHAYGVPAAWMELSDRPLGDGIKFRDYLASVGYPETMQPARVEPGRSHHHLASLPSLPPRPFDARKLLRACPFVDPRRFDRLLDDCVHVWRRPRDVYS